MTSQIVEGGCLGGHRRPQHDPIDLRKCSAGAAAIMGAIAVRFAVDVELTAEEQITQRGERHYVFLEIQSFWVLA